MKLKMKIYLLVMAAGLVWVACRKMDREMSTSSETVKAIENKFFTSRNSSEPLVNAIKVFLKTQNDKYSFIEKTVKQIGYPYWDKTITMVGPNPVQSVTGGDSIEVTYIPFVRDTQNFVNAALIVKTSETDTTFTYLCDWQYKQFGFDTTGTNWNAKNVFHVFARLDRNVFGRNEFRITDSSLLSQSEKTALANQGLSFEEANVTYRLRNADNSNNSGNLWTQVTMCDEIDWCILEETPFGPKGNNVSSSQSGPCPTGVIIVYTVCTDTWVYIASSGGGTTGGNPGGGTGGGTGGSPTPPTCSPSPCPTGWEPTGGVTATKDPCDKAARLKNDSLYKAKAMELKAATNLNYEKGYLEDTGGAFLYVEGPQGEGSLPIAAQFPVASINHSHYDGKMFSIDDLKTAWDFMRTNNIVDTAFTVGVSTNAGTSYIFTIDDRVKFQAFGNYYFGIYGDIDNLKLKYDRKRIGLATTEIINEERFLELVEDEDIGISLLKADNSFSNYQKLILNQYGILTTVPCN